MTNEHLPSHSASPAQAPDTVQQILDAIRLTEHPLGEVTRSDAERSWTRVASRMEAATQPRMASAHTKKRSWRRYGVVMSSAVGAALMLVMVMSPMFQPDGHEGSAPTQVVTTGRGERATVELGDGSVIRLSAGTTVRYPAMTGDMQERTIELDGEAFFEIRHGAHTPLTVITRNARTRVLGTAFGVRQYMGDDETRVTVAEGKVGVRREEEMGTNTVHERVLTKGQMAVVQAHTISVQPSDFRNLAWRNGRVEFDDTPLPAALRELERWYDIRFVVRDTSVLRQHINATFATDSLENVTRILGLLLGAPIVRADTTLIIG